MIYQYTICNRRGKPITFGQKEKGRPSIGNFIWKII